MANYNADIQIAVKGKAKLNQLEKQLKRITALQTKIRQPATLKVNTAGALKQIDVIDRRLRALNRTVQVRVNERNSRRRGSGDGGGSSVNPGAAVAGLGGVAAASLLSRQKKSFGLGVDVGQLRKVREDISFELNAVEEMVKKETAELEKKTAKYKEVLANWGPDAPQTQTSRVFLRKREDRNREIIGRRNELSQRLELNAGAIKKAEAAQAKLNATAAKSQGPLSGLATRVGAAAAAYVGFDQVVRQVSASIQAAARSESSIQRIKALSDGFDDYNSVLEVAANAQAKFNLSQLEAQDAVAQLYGRLRPLGLNLREIEDVFNGFNTAAALTGATSSESAGALLQLSQALGAGALRGEEFNSVAEQAPAVLQAIAKEMDKPVGALKELAKEGKITSDVVVSALRRVEQEGGDRLAQALDTSSQKFKTFQNRVEELQIAFGKLALPAVEESIESLGDAADAAAKDLEKTARAQRNLNKMFGDMNNIIPSAIEGLEGLNTSLTDIYINQLANIPGWNNIIRTLQALAWLRDRVAGDDPLAPPPGYTGMADMSGDPILPERSLRERLGLTGDGSTGGNSGNRGRSSGGSANSAADEAARLLEQQLQTGTELSREFTRQLQLRQALTPLDRELLQISFDREDRERRIAEAAEKQRAALKGLSDDLASSATIGAVLDQTFEKTGKFRDLLKGIEAFNKDLAESLDTTTYQSKVLAETWNGIGTQVSGVFEALVTGTEDWNSVLNDTLRSLSSLLLKAGLNALGGDDKRGFFSILSGNFGGARANGGPVSGGKSYLVGEKGPELFIPRSSGTVMANGTGGVTVINNINVADGTTTSSTSGGSQNDAAKLARMMEASTMAVITRERRPGGILSR